MKLHTVDVNMFPALSAVSLGQALCSIHCCCTLLVFPHKVQTLTRSALNRFFTLVSQPKH